MAFTHRELAGADAVAVFVSCTNFRAPEVTDELTDALGMPVTSSNTATLAAVLDRLG